MLLFFSYKLMKCLNDYKADNRCMATAIAPWQKEIVFPNLDVISMFLYICGCNYILKPLFIINTILIP